MSTATVNSIVALVRSRLNITSVNTISDVEIQNFILSSHAQLYEKIVSRWKNYYLTGRYVMDLKSLQETYALPADFRANAQVFMRFGTGVNLIRKPLEPINLSELSNRAPIYAIQPQWPVRYFLAGMTITFTPVPSQDFNQSIEIWYTPMYRAPTNFAGPFDLVLPTGWDLLVELDVCVKVAARMRFPEYYQMYSAERKAVEEQVLAASSIRDEQPQYMTDAFAQPDFDFTFYGTPGV